MRTFAQLFAGRTDFFTHLNYVPGSVEDGTKNKGQVVRAPGELTQEDYESHYAGRQAIGVVPITEDDTVSFFMIDVDRYGEQHQAPICRKLATLSLPLVPFRSKSWGLHLYCFLDKPIPAARAKELAEMWCGSLGLPAPGKEGVEVFPKQDTVRKIGGGDNLGNAINLPLFGDDRPMLDMEGKPIPKDQAVDICNAHLYTPPPADPKAKKTAVQKRRRPKQGNPITEPEQLDPHRDFPPCLEEAITNKVSDGEGRDQFLLQIALVLYKATGKDPDKTFDCLQWWQGEMFEDRKDNDALRRVVSQAVKGYAYQCSSAACAARCDAEECRWRTFGIKGKPEAGLTGENEITAIEVLYIQTQDPHFLVTIGGKTIYFSSIEEITRYENFCNQCIKQGFVSAEFSSYSQPLWAKYIRAKITELGTLSARGAGTEMSVTKQIQNAFKHFCQNKVGTAESTRPNNRTEAWSRYDKKHDKLCVAVDHFMTDMTKPIDGVRLKRTTVDWALHEIGFEIEHSSSGHDYWTHKGMPEWMTKEDPSVDDENWL